MFTEIAWCVMFGKGPRGHCRGASTILWPWRCLLMMVLAIKAQAFEKSRTQNNFLTLIIEPICSILLSANNATILHVSDSSLIEFQWGFRIILALRACVAGRILWKQSWTKFVSAKHFIFPPRNPLFFLVYLLPMPPHLNILTWTFSPPRGSWE